MKNFEELIKQRSPALFPNIVGDMSREFRAKLGCPTEEELCEYLEGISVDIDPNRHMRLEDHIWGTLRASPCFACLKDMQELCEVLEDTTTETTLEQVEDIAKQVFETKHPYMPSVLRFLSLLRWGEKVVRVKAAELMRDFGTSSHVHWLRPLLSDEIWQVRGNAILLIKELGNPLHLMWIRPLLEDESQEVRDNANRALEELTEIAYIVDPDTNKIVQKTVKRIKDYALRFTGKIYSAMFEDISIRRGGEQSFGIVLDLVTVNGGGKIENIENAHRISTIEDEEGTSFAIDNDLAAWLRASPESGLEAIIYWNDKDVKLIPNVEITLIDEDGNETSVLTKGSGWANLGSYKPGRYAVLLKHPEFSKESIVLNLEEARNV